MKKKDYLMFQHNLPFVRLMCVNNKKDGMKTTNNKIRENNKLL